MASTARYLYSVKNLPAIFQKIRDGIPPEKFNYDHLKAIGFGASGDRAVVPLLKDLGFLTSDGSPTQTYRDYRNQSRSKAILGEALRQAYPDVFVINEHITKTDRDAVTGLFKSLHSVSDTVADFQQRTFFALLELADIKSRPNNTEERIVPPSAEARVEIDETGKTAVQNRTGAINMPLTYRFEIQLPATKDVDVFRAIFRAMREELLNE